MSRVTLATLVLAAAAAGGIGGMVLRDRRELPPDTPLVVAAVPAPPAVPKITVLVAAHAMHAGSLLQSEDMAGLSVPQDKMPIGASVDSVDARTALRGAMLRESLAADEPIRAGAVLHPGDRGFLAAVLAPGLRATSVAVDSVSGTAGLIWPGDHIDLILTQSFDDSSRPAGKRVVGERVLRDVRVIAVDQQLIEGAQQNQFPSGTPSSNRVLTLEVTEVGAERVAVATRLGHLVAVVRSTIGSGSQDAEMRATWADDVSRALLPPAAAKRGSEIRLFRASEQPVSVKF
jgi:pilus assembly protein CpaB